LRLQISDHRLNPIDRDLIANDKSIRGNARSFCRVRRTCRTWELARTANRGEPSLAA
jgi:hypothetical protein